MSESNTPAPWEGITTEEVIEMWDNGEQIYTAVMGDLGPVYEAAIQNLGFVLLKEMLEDPFDVDDDAPDDEKFIKWSEYVTKMESLPSFVKEVEALDSTLSGAQVGAAFNLSNVIARNGYEEAMNMLPKDRVIVMTKTSSEDLVKSMKAGSDNNVS